MTSRLPVRAKDPERVIHLSDLHIAASARSAQVLRYLPAALAACVREQGAPAVAAIFVTGDLFDTSDFDRTDAMNRFVDLYKALMAALLQPVPVILLPGNHDRRKAGVLGPHDPTLFHALARAAAAVHEAPVFVAGCANRRAEIVPATIRGTRAQVATYDTTVLLRGLFSAGGEIRQDEIMWLLAALSRMSQDDAPLLLLTHHHLIPTPLTDFGRVDLRRRGFVAKWLVGEVLPSIVSNADREELTMTALGAGTALSTLHGVNRPVVVLHGHKHYPTARLVVGTDAGENDVVILSAGSAGLAEAWAPTEGRDTGHLWPSFNVLDMAPDDALIARTIAFSPTSGRLAPARTLVDIKRSGLRWQVQSQAVREAASPLLERNEARFSLSAQEDRWTLRCHRLLAREMGHGDAEYVEVVEAAPGAKVERVVDARGEHFPGSLPFKLRVSTLRESFYQVNNALCRTLPSAERAYGRSAGPFEWVGLVNRVPSREAVLMLEGLPPSVDAFASVTDLTTGREHVASLGLVGSQWRLVCQPCPARVLLRIYIVL